MWNRIAWNRIPSRIGTPAARAGASALETAIVMPVVLTLLFGLADLGLAVFSYNTLAEAACVGARYASLRGADSASPLGPTGDNSLVEGAVRSATTGLQANALVVHSTWIDGSNDRNRRVRVDLNYTYQPVITWVIGVRTLALSSTCTMTITN